MIKKSSKLILAILFLFRASSAFASESLTLKTNDPYSSVNIRDGDSMSAKVISSKKDGESIVVVEERYNIDQGFTWYKIRLNNSNFGWVRGDFVNDPSP